MADEQKKLTEEEFTFSEIIGDLVEQWGFNRNLGRVWSLLFLTSKPLSQTDIQDLLALSAGAVSSTLTELQIWGVVKRVRVSGDRNFYFEPELKIWKSVSNVLRAREIRILTEAKSGLRALFEKLAEYKTTESSFQQKRINAVIQTIEYSTELITILVEGGIKMAKLAKLFNQIRSM